MTDQAYYNGVLTPYDAATVPLCDRSIFFGEAVYDVVLGSGGIPYQLTEHLRRLRKNAEAIGLSNIPSEKELREAIEMTIQEADADSFILYIQLSGNQRRRTHSRCADSANLLITVTSGEIPSELSFVSAITLPDLRHGYCNIKTINLLGSVLSICDAEKCGCDLAIFEKGGIVTEASHANVSIITNDVLITHPRDTSVLPGISEDNLIRICNEIGIPHREREFSTHEMMSADLVLITSTTKLIRVCDKINGIPLDIRNIATAHRIFSTMRQNLLDKTS